MENEATVTETMNVEEKAENGSGKSNNTDENNDSTTSEEQRDNKENNTKEDATKSGKKAKGGKSKTGKKSAKTEKKPKSETSALTKEEREQKKQDREVAHLAKKAEKDRAIHGRLLMGESVRKERADKGKKKGNGDQPTEATEKDGNKPVKPPKTNNGPSPSKRVTDPSAKFRYWCKACDYKINKTFNWKKHILTKKCRDTCAKSGMSREDCFIVSLDYDGKPEKKRKYLEITGSQTMRASSLPPEIFKKEETPTIPPPKKRAKKTKNTKADVNTNVEDVNDLGDTETMDL